MQLNMDRWKARLRTVLPEIKQRGRMNIDVKYAMLDVSRHMIFMYKYVCEEVYDGANIHCVSKMIHFLRAYISNAFEYILNLFFAYC